MNNGQMDLGNENPTQHLPLIIEGRHEKIPVWLVGTGIWTRNLPNMNSVCYYCATSLDGAFLFLEETKIITMVLKILLLVGYS